MSRRTAFPNIWVDSISVQKPPFDESGVVQEFVGRGATREFPGVKRASKIEEDTVQKIIGELEEMIGPISDSFRLRYHLRVRTGPTKDIVEGGPIEEFDGWLKERTVSSRARAFARAKNPFEPDVFEVSDPVFNEGMSGRDMGDFYNVTVTVTK